MDDYIIVVNDGYDGWEQQLSLIIIIITILRPQDHPVSTPLVSRCVPRGMNLNIWQKHTLTVTANANIQPDRKIELCSKICRGTDSGISDLP